jgi:hypothetical protein
MVRNELREKHLFDHKLLGFPRATFLKGRSNLELTNISMGNHAMLDLTKNESFL